MNLRELEFILYDQGINSVKLTSNEFYFLNQYKDYIALAKSEKDKASRQALVIMAANDPDFAFCIE